MSSPSDDMRTLMSVYDALFMAVCYSLCTEWKAAFLSAPHTCSWMRSRVGVSMLKTVSIPFHFSSCISDFLVEQGLHDDYSLKGLI